ncbi:unnamed protein product [Mycena citricolor]|uniref:Phosphatidic acid phosphatase type 2/haloperoxidase domain-containing protein n=1 Tax=Mycena citricolor TaxID=2018698 RepID=A0AAD2HA37_9AGAR|nr:unnamed protein product [Mycena citricolor]
MARNQKHGGSGGSPVAPINTSARYTAVSFSMPDSAATSPASSRASSPMTPTFPGINGTMYEKSEANGHGNGNGPMDVYDATLPPWRAAVRRKLVEMIKRESVLLANMQDRIRSPALDAYFLHTSALGSHTFFMMFLPMLFFFGFPELGRGLIVVLTLGIYITSVAKDLFCAPRPFAPPVTRLTIGTHHLEYGMPSTHSTNCVSLALFFFAYIHELAFPATPEPALISLSAYTGMTIGLTVYMVSIVFGRLYTAMHSFIDCAAGVAIGAFIWLAHTSFPGIPVSLPSSGFSTTLLRGWGWGAYLDEWVLQTPSSWKVPLTLIPLALLAVNQHPQPVDDCPCFEDAIAVGSVMLGMFIGKWGAIRWDWGAHRASVGLNAVMPGSGWALGSDGVWDVVPRTWGHVGTWWAVAAAKMTFGILSIFVWRLVAKAVFLRVLPPTFRIAARLMRLPRRRFYTPATDYAGSAPPLDKLRPIPSVIDLPSETGVEVGGIGSGSGIGIGVNGARGLRRRAEAVEAARNTVAVPGMALPENEVDREKKHYDAEVLTKVIVYAGIAIIACEVMPVLFEMFGWGVRSWP